MRHTRRRALWGALALGLALGCSGSSVVGGPADADTADLGTDLGAAKDTGPADTGAPLDTPVPDDAAPDAPVADAGPPDAPMDTPAPTDTGPTACTSNTDCAGQAGGPVCDTASGRCVPCTAADDRCPTGQYCDATALTCVMGCRNDEACTGAPSADGGVAPARRCDPATRACVECVTNTHCPPGNLCVGSVCVTGCTSERPCPAGQSCCAGACVDPISNVAHCGACDNRCRADNATAACQNGLCAVGQCVAPFADCDRLPGNGCEANTLSDTMHCGACNAACPARPNAQPRCAAGTCGFTCNAGFADCDGNADNGCEVELARDTAHCGACAAACNPPNGVAACTAGRCTVASCAQGFGDCDGNPTNGCEVDTRTSVSHCGACAAACAGAPNAVPACLGGRCVTSCVTGYQDCNADDTDGCEVDQRTSAQHCGGCGRACAPANATGMCTAGRCTVARCADGFADCDGNADNGCEVNTRSDVSHCGTCNTACTTMGGTPACRDGVCGLGTCAQGRGDCDGNTGNGCETDTQTSTAHCGACGSACNLANATSACAGGRCAVARCNEGFADCDGNPANGCEVDTRTDASHCGACGSVCAPNNAAGACFAGRCTVAACRSGFADCNGSATDGCEVSLASDAAHCGACGNTCRLSNATSACAGGSCTIAACNSGFGNCNVNPADGCEVATSTSTNHCGACGNVCRLANTASHTCSGGACGVASCAGGFGDCDGNPGNGCESSLNTATHCGACNRRPGEQCNLADDNCNGQCDESAGCRVAVHRTFRSSPFEHFYTTSRGEATGAGFSIEYDSYYYLYSAPAPGLVPFYRCLMGYNKHFYTTAGSPGAPVYQCETASPGRIEGILGYIATSAQCGAVPLYRLYNAGTTSHFFTTSSAERDSAVAGGWRNEGIAGYVWPSP
jgi:hypothetical protein